MFRRLLQKVGQRLFDQVRACESQRYTLGSAHALVSEKASRPSSSRFEPIGGNPANEAADRIVGRAGSEEGALLWNVPSGRPIFRFSTAACAATWQGTGDEAAYTYMHIYVCIYNYLQCAHENSFFIYTHAWIYS